MASPRAADEASAFETDEDTRAETPDGGDDFVSATAFKSPRGGYACGVADLSSDGEDEHADVVDDDARAFDRAYRRGRASSFRGVDAESRDDSSEGGHSSSESTVRADADATGADDDDDDAPWRLGSPREILANDLNQEVLRHVQHVMRLQNDPEAFPADAEHDAFASSGNGNQNDFGDDFDGDDFFSSRRDSFPRDDVWSPYERTVSAEVPVDVSSATTQIDLLNTSLNDLDLFWDPARRDEDDREASWFLYAADATRATQATQSPKSVSEDDQPKDDSFFTALLELWFNWSSVDKTWFLYGSGVFENARDRDRFEDYLEVYLRMELHRRVFASDGETPSEATRRVVDAFVRVFGREPKTERDFRLCLTPCKTYDIETRAVTGLVFPGPTIGAPPFEVLDFATNTLVVENEQKKEISNRPPYQKCLYFDAQGWCPDGTRCRWKSAHVARRRPERRRSYAFQSLQKHWKELDDPNAPPRATRDGYPYASFGDWRDEITFQRLRSMQTQKRALFCDEKKNDDEDEPVWSSPERRMSGSEASSRD
jgi:hypothetical protein